MTEMTVVSDDGLYAATHHYQRDSDSRAVELIGMMHVGEPSYFDGVRRRLEEAVNDGSAVVVEGVRRSERETYNRIERAVLAQFSAGLDAMYGFIAETCGLETQRAALPRRDEWISGDVLDIHLIRTIGLARASMLAVLTKNFARLLLATNVTVTREVMVEMLSHDEDSTVRHLLKGHGITTIRDRVGAHAILREARTRDVVTTWGAGHVPGIDRQLREAGFDHMKTTWSRVFRMMEEDR